MFSCQRELKGGSERVAAGPRRYRSALRDTAAAGTLAEGEIALFNHYFFAVMDVYAGEHRTTLDSDA